MRNEKKEVEPNYEHEQKMDELQQFISDIHEELTAKINELRVHMDEQVSRKEPMHTHSSNDNDKLEDLYATIDTFKSQLDNHDK